MSLYPISFAAPASLSKMNFSVAGTARLEGLVNQPIQLQLLFETEPGQTGTGGHNRAPRQTKWRTNQVRNELHSTKAGRAEAGRSRRHPTRRTAHNQQRTEHFRECARRRLERLLHGRGAARRTALHQAVAGTFARYQNRFPVVRSAQPQTMADRYVRSGLPPAGTTSTSSAIWIPPFFARKIWKNFAMQSRTAPA